MSKKNLNPIWIAVGGTGGHILPAQQLAELLQEKKEDLFFAGSGLSTNPFFQKGSFSFLEVASTNFQKKGWIPAFWILFKGVVKAFYHMRKQRPKALVGFGSFHSFPLLVAAYLQRVPIFLFEPNCVMGKVNAFFAKKAKVVAIQFSCDSYQKLPFKLVKPLPWKKTFSPSCRNPEVLRILIFGGSQGASWLNQRAVKALALLKKQVPSLKVVHLSGKENPKTIAKDYDAYQISSQVLSFEKNIDALYAQTDLVMSRSGASTVAELIHYELPALLIPYPFAVKQHQQANAQFFEKEVKGGILLLENQATEEILAEKLGQLLKHYDFYRQNIQEYKRGREPYERHFAALILEGIR